MGIDETREIIIKYKDDPLEDIEKDAEYQDAVNVILEAVENGAYIVEKEKSYVTE